MKLIGSRTLVFLSLVVLLVLSSCSTPSGVMGVSAALSDSDSSEQQTAEREEKGSTHLGSNTDVTLETKLDGFVHAYSDTVDYRINGVHEVSTLLWVTRDEAGNQKEMPLIETVNRFGPLVGTWMRGEDENGNRWVRVYKFAEDIP